MSAKAERFVLVVEDSDVDYDILDSVITRGDQVEQLVRQQRGEEAIEFLQEQVTKGLPLPSLILMDLNLVGMSGIETVRKIRSDEKLKFIPSVILSTSSSQTDINASYLAGANTYLAKPLALDEFEKMVSRFMVYWFGAAKLPVPVRTTLMA